MIDRTTLLTSVGKKSPDVIVPLYIGVEKVFVKSP